MVGRPLVYIRDHKKGALNLHMEDFAGIINEQTSLFVFCDDLACRKATVLCGDYFIASAIGDFSF